MSDDGTGTPLSRRAFLGNGGARARSSSAGRPPAGSSSPRPRAATVRASRARAGRAARVPRATTRSGCSSARGPHGLIAAFDCVDADRRALPGTFRGLSEEIDALLSGRVPPETDLGAAAAGQRRAGGGHRPGPDGHGLGRRLAVRRPVRAGRPQAAGAGHDAVPGQRPARPGPLARGRAARAAGQGAGRLRARAAPGDSPDPVRAGGQVDAGHVHPARRDPEGRADPEPQPARLQGRHRESGRRRRGPDEHTGLDVDRGHRADRAGPRARLDRRRDIPGGPDHPDAGRALGPGLAGRAGGDLRPAQGVRRAAVG